jgi:hypothetical protein
MRKILQRATIVLVLVVFLAGCSGMFGIGSDSTVKPLTPKAQATLFMNTYKAEIKDLQSLSSLPKATDAQKAVFKSKQAILGKMKPILDIYVAVVDSGGTPDTNLQGQLNDFINQLVAQGGVK